MKLAAIFLLASVLASDQIYPGNIYISTIDGHPAHKQLGVVDGKIVSGTSYTIFDYSPSGTIKVRNVGKNLAFDLGGTLVLQDASHSGFLVTRSGWENTRNITYHGSSGFQLCGDGSIGHDSRCTGAQKIELTYDDVFNPR